MSTNITRQIVLDTETTGINKFGMHYEGHKIIEIGAVEIIDRCLTSKKFHIYLNPNRTIDPEAYQVHGISNQFLKKKPIFSEIVDDFLKFICNSELIIHNAPFDLGFINYELNIVNKNFKKIESYCKITDTLKLAQKKFPGQRNNLDALCERYSISNSKRILHNALVDAQLLANVFLSMTGGQIAMKFFEMSNDTSRTNKTNVSSVKSINTTSISSKLLKVIYADQKEILAHEKYLDRIQKVNKYCLWKKINE